MSIKTTTDDNLKIEIFADVDDHEFGEGVYSYSVDDFALVGPDGELWLSEHLFTPSEKKISCIEQDTLETFFKDIGVHDFILDHLNYHYNPADYYDEDYGRDR
jgi:hypothetical protein